MKPIIVKSTAFLLAAVLLLAAAAFTRAPGPSNPPADVKGYWIAKAGTEYLFVGKAVLPANAYVKDAKGELKSINNQRLKNSLRFSNKATVNGKKIDSHLFVVSEVDETITVGSVARRPNEVYGQPLPASSMLLRAVQVCYGVPLESWQRCGISCATGNFLSGCGRTNCSHKALNFCFAISSISGTVNVFYVVCAQAAY